jgi:hypothetical protein
MSRAEVQRKVRVTAAVITQRPAPRAVPGPDRGLQMGPLVGAQPHRIGFVPVAPLSLAPGELAQETLATRLTQAAAAPLVPGQERPMWWGRRRKITPRSLITGLLRHAYDTTFAVRYPVPGGKRGWWPPPGLAQSAPPAQPLSPHCG